MSVTYLVQQEDVPAGGYDRHDAVRAMLGACMLGALQQYGKADHRRHHTSGRDDVQLWQLADVLGRQDKGVHGFGFEYALHSTINGAPTIPPAIVRRVQLTLAAHVGVIFAELGVPWTDMGERIRSVMYGIEKRGLRETTGAGTVAELGRGALLWPKGGSAPYLLADLVPRLRCPAGRSSRAPGWDAAGHRSGLRDPARLVQADVPVEVSNTWRTDLFLGGADVERSQQVVDLVGDDAATAWVSASLKYAAGQLEGGRGLHLGIDTNCGRRPEAVPRPRTDGLRHVQLRVEDDFLTVFDSAWRILYVAAGQHFARSTPRIRVHSEDAPLVAELSQHKRTPVLELADLLLGYAPNLLRAETADLVPGSPEVPGTYPRSHRRVPLWAPVPSTLHVAA